VHNRGDVKSTADCAPGNTVQVQNVKQGLTYVGNQAYAFNIGGADPSLYWTGVTGEAGALRLPYPGDSGLRFDAATITVNSAYTNPTSIGLYSGTLTKPRLMEFALRYSF
jgi:hypothetical protein